MERKVNFVVGEHYHIFSRGTEKRKVFIDEKDYQRFQALLYILNQDNTFHLSQFLKRGQKNILEVYGLNRSKNLVNILAYSLMPNHFHILLEETVKGGISKFMGKLLTAHSMYFNTRYERSGSLFLHPFRSVHIKDDIHFKYLFSYIHLNCLDIVDMKWKLKGIDDKKTSDNFLRNYKYSSYPDFIESINQRQEFNIINKSCEFLPYGALDIEDFELWHEGNP